MSIVVIGGHSRSVGKTSVVAGLIAALPELRWTALKITQYGHGICSASGKSCHCATDDHSWAISEEKDRSGESDTSRFLVAGAVRAWWVRTEQGRLAEAMPKVRQTIAAAENVRVALLLVARGEAPLGIVYATDAAVEPGVRVVGTIPSETHPPIIYPVALTSTSENPSAAALLVYLRCTVARAEFQKAGFRMLEQQPPAD